MLGADEDLEAAPATAEAGFAVLVDRQVPDLTGGEPFAQHQAAAEHHARADTVFECDDEQVVAGLGLERVHPEGRGVGVVEHVHGQPEVLGELCL